MNNYIYQPEHSIRNAETYTVQEIAQILNIKERAAYNFCNSTSSFSVVRIGRLVRVKKESFDIWFYGGD